ncbi:Hypp7476 [Branchiostoma lanceolatum]|uniref:Hypp7476 protein n=1 Tax=Branchiostoma lanceolatum TaxID=7740 RepID=A0A8K0EEC4_BRALA|nr:Hypp7476 [Branchiostoma lanceolatum]
MSRSTSGVFVLALLAVAMTTMVAGNNICRAARFTTQMTVNGRVKDVEAGECVVRDNYRIRPKFSGYDASREDFLQNSFRVTDQECCCRVSQHILRTVRFGSAHIKYKDILSCSCQPC